MSLMSESLRLCTASRMRKITMLNALPCRSWIGLSYRLVIIHAKDDPFMTDDVIPKFVLPDNIDYRLFQKGGHVGFITGSTLKSVLLEEALPAYYESIQDSAMAEPF